MGSRLAVARAGGACYLRGVTVPRALLLVLALLQAGGVFELARRASCEEACRRDGCEDDCTPERDAPQCSCHCPGAVVTAPAVFQVATRAPLPALAARFEAAERRHDSPDPREILHVPRLRVG